jgi:hypothetical protein
MTGHRRAVQDQAAMDDRHFMRDKPDRQAVGRRLHHRGDPFEGNGGLD